MKTRRMGATDIYVSEFGLGCWQLGNVEDWGQPMSDTDGIELVHAALASGCNFFDTAPPYARGNSERVLGKALTGRRDQAIICSKFGYTAEYGVDFSVTGLQKSLEASLDRLNTDYLDILLMHSPADEFYTGEMPQFEMLETLKKQGKIRAYGISADLPEHLMHILEHTDSEVMEAPYSLFSQQAASAFDAAAQKGVGLIAKVPLDSGWLSGKYNANSQFKGARGRWSAQQKQIRADLLTKLFEQFPTLPLLETALQFSVSHPAIASTIPGTKHITQLRSAIEALKSELAADQVAALQEFWQHHVQHSGYDW